MTLTLPLSLVKGEATHVHAAIPVEPTIRIRTPQDYRNFYGQKTTRARSGNSISFLARPPAGRSAGEDRRFLGILPSHATGPRIRAAAHRRNSDAPPGDR